MTHFRIASRPYVFSVTVTNSNCGDNPRNSTQRACLMAGNIGHSTARLEGLVTRIMKETDPARYDELCSELWLILNERESSLLAQKAELAEQ